MYAASTLFALTLFSTPLQVGQAPGGTNATWRVIAEESVFAVVTEKDGFAARLAHNHLIVAGDYTVTLEYDAARPTAAGVEFSGSAHGLIVDDPEQRARWEPRIVELGLVSELGTPGDDDREKIGREMLADGQLDAETYPDISARVVSIREEAIVIGGTEFPFSVVAEVGIRDRTVQRTVGANVDTDGTLLNIEVLGEFTFEEFGIEPYSAFLGSVKNKNDFHIYLNFKATR